MSNCKHTVDEIRDFCLKRPSCHICMAERIIELEEIIRHALGGIDVFIENSNVVPITAIKETLEQSFG